MKISSKLFLGNLIFTLLVVILFVGTIVILGILHSSINETTSGTLQTVKTLEELKFNGLRIVSSTMEYVLLIKGNGGGDKSEVQQITEKELITLGINNCYSSLQKYDSLIHEFSPADSIHFKRINNALFLLINRSKEIISLKKLDFQRAEIIAKKELFEKDEYNFLSVVDDVLIKKELELKEKQTNISLYLTKSKNIITYTIILVFIVITVIGFFLKKSISMPIKKLRDATHKIKDGTYESGIEVKSNDEIGELSHSFNLMAAKLKETFDNLNLEIKERIQAEEALKFSENKFRALIENSAEGISLVDKNGVLIYSSPAGNKILGHDNNGTLGRQIFDQIFPADMEAALMTFKELIGNPGSSFVYEARMKHKSGQYIWIESTVTNMLNQPFLNAIVVNFRNITERKESEEKLKASEIKFRSTVESTKAILFSTNSQGQFTYLNDAACSLLGMRNDELIGKFYLRFVYPEARAATHSFLRKQLIKPTPNVNLEVHIISNLGKDGWLYLMVNPVYKENQIIGLSSVALDITDRKITEEKLKESERRYREFADFLPQPVFEYDINGKFTFANRASFAATGYTIDDLKKGKTIFDLIDPAQHKTLTEMMKQRMDNIPAGGTEYTIIRKDDSTFSAIGYASPIISGGKVTGIRGMIVDITERKRIEAILKQNAARLEMLNDIGSKIAGTLDLELIMDKAVKLILENFKYNHVSILTYKEDEYYVVLKAIAGAFESLFEKNIKIYLEKGMIIWAAKTGNITVANDVRIDPHYVNVYPDMIDTLSELCIPLKIGTKVFGILDIQCPYLNAFKEGDINVLVTLADQIALAINNSLLYQAVQKELNERIKTERALKESEISYRTLSKNLPASVYRLYLRENGRMEFFNDVIEKISGYSKEELLKGEICSIDPFISSDDKPHVLKIVKDAITKNCEFEAEYKFKRKDGKLSYFYEKGKPILGYDGKPMYIDGVIFDITDRKMAEEELKLLVSSKDKLFSIVAHDLKSPFLGLLGYSDYLVEEFGNLNKDEIKEYIDKSRIIVRNLYKLVENLLEWARLQTGRMSFNPKEILLSNNVIFVSELLSENANRKNIKINNRINSSLKVKADEKLLNLILENLISNSIKFTRPGGNIFITSLENKGMVEVNISDNGVGISKEIKEKLFDLKSTHTAEGTAGEKGTGLGLLICKEMVEKQSGKIWVESEEGKGSAFTFTVPLA